MNNQLTVAGYFGGAGGGILGARWAGFKPVLNYEPRDFVDMQAFYKNFPGALLTTLPHMANLGEVDLVIGSPDCKVFSNLRTKKREDVSTIELTDIDFCNFMLRVEKDQPGMFVLENVTNIIKHIDFKDTKHLMHFSGRFLVDLSHYEITVLRLNSKDFGVPQSRKRVFFIGIRKDRCGNVQAFREINGYQVATFLDDTAVNEYFAPPYYATVREALSDLEPQAHELPKHSAKRVHGFTNLKPGESYYGTQNNRRLELDKVCGTIASHCSRFVHPTEPRTLTVRETARLMGYPDDFVFEGNWNQQLDQIGKGIVPQVAWGVCGLIKQYYLPS